MEKPNISIKDHKKTICLDRYAGDWVAFAHGKVIAHQGTLKKLMRETEKVKKKFSVFLVPRKNERPCV
jgi:hypothetical protein